jgi:hypothetical protein
MSAVDSLNGRRVTVATAVFLAFATVGADVAAAAPDLIVTRVSNPPPQVGAGRLMAVGDVTRNTGESRSPRSTTRYYLSRDSSRGNDRLLAGRAVGRLSPGGFERGGRNVLIPGTTPVGTYRVLACADGRGRVNEESDGNNCRASRGRVAVMINQPPVLGVSGGTTNVTEDGPPVRLDPGLTVADPDDMSLAGATVGYTPPVDCNDRDREVHYVEQLGIMGTYDSGTGILTLTGTASVADYQTALRSIWLVTSCESGGSTTARIGVNDGLGFTPGGYVTRAITLIAVNDAPTINTTTTALNYAPGSGPQRVDPELALLDPDSDISGATVRITSGHNQNQDELGFTNQLGITGTYNSGTGVLTLTGTTTVANYQAALRSVTYVNTSSTPSSASRTVVFRATDAQGADSNAASRQIDVMPVP